MLVSYLFGRLLLWRLRFSLWLEKFCFCIVLGMGVIAYLVMLLGLVGLLYPAVLLMAIVAGVAACYPVWARSLREWGRWREMRVRRLLWLAVGAAAVIALLWPIWLAPLYPPTAFDATMYHLPYARNFAREHWLVVTPDIRYPVFPQTNEMLFTLALLLYDDILAQLIECLLLVLLTASLVAYGMRFLAPRAGWWAAGLLLANPLVLWLSSVPYVDIGLALFVTMAVYAFEHWMSSRQGKWLALAGIFGGLAAGTKYAGLFFVCFLQLSAFYAAWRGRRWREPLIFGAAAIAVAGPWLARNFYYSRNPIFPLFQSFFGQLFGYRFWDRIDEQFLITHFASYGVGKSLMALLLLPWRLAFDQKLFLPEEAVSRLYILTLPLLLVVGLKSLPVRRLLVMTAAYTIFWFLSCQQMRFLVPVLPLLSLSAGAALDWAVSRLPGLARWREARLLTALVCVALAASGLYTAANRVKRQGRLPVNKQQRDAYLAGVLPSYPVYQWLNGAKGSHYTVYSWGHENMVYYADGRLLGDHFGAARYERILSQALDEQSLFRALKELGAEYLSRSPEVFAQMIFRTTLIWAFRALFSADSCKTIWRPT